MFIMDKLYDLRRRLASLKRRFQRNNFPKTRNRYINNVLVQIHSIYIEITMLPGNNPRKRELIEDILDAESALRILLSTNNIDLPRICNNYFDAEYCPGQ